MKYIILLITVSLLVSCSPKYYCTPPKGSKDYAVRQWMKQESSGYWTVTTQIGFGAMTKKTFECKPSSKDLEMLKNRKTTDKL